MWRIRRMLGRGDLTPCADLIDGYKYSRCACTKGCLEESQSRVCGCRRDGNWSQSTLLGRVANMERMVYSEGSYQHHRNSRPMPTWKPFRNPSLLLATSGTPKLTSTRIGSSLYTRPRPAEMDGLDILEITLSINGRAAKKTMSLC